MHNISYARKVVAHRDLWLRHCGEHMQGWEQDKLSDSPCADRPGSRVDANVGPAAP